MSEAIDILIQKKEAELLPFCTRMEELKLEFIKETVNFASKWFEKTAREYVTKYPEITLHMSEEKILEMKNKINLLVENSEKIVKAKLNNPALWWHLTPHPRDSISKYTQIADKYPEILDQAVRRVLGSLGVILAEFSFHVETMGDTGSFEEFWFEHSSDSEKIVPFYPHLLTWTDKMQDIIRKYDSEYTQAVLLFDEIQKLKTEKKKQQAITRWDSI